MYIRWTSLRTGARQFGLGIACLFSLTALSFGDTIGNLSYWAAPGVQDGYGGTELAIGAWNGSLSSAGYVVAAPTVGEVITAPTDNNTLLQSFGVTMVGSSPGFQMNMTAAVFAWDQSDFRPMGPALASSSITTPVTSAPAPYLNNFYNLVFSPDAQLSPGQQYVVLFSTLGVPQSLLYYGTSFGVTYTDTYNGGEMVFASAGALHESSTPLSAIETERWGQTGSCDELQLSTLCLGSAQGYFQYPGIVAPDLAFSADFEPATAAVPEPASLSLFGIACLACWCRKRTSRLLERHATLAAVLVIIAKIDRVLGTEGRTALAA